MKFKIDGQTKSNDEAFTLIELLVVIAIIGILAAILLPVLNRSKDTALGVACLNNTKEIATGVLMYCDDNQDYFPQVTPWWTAGPYKNKLGINCGGEWFLSDGKTPNTIAPMLASYVTKNIVWVCAKRRRGSDYITPSGLVSGQEPSITGFLSYGFNEIGVFGGPDPNTGLMTGNTQKFKATVNKHPSDMVAICDVSGSNDPSHINGDADAPWLDTEWAGNSGQLFGVTGFNERVQTCSAKHNNRINVVYVDSHAAPTYPSQLIWGQFWGIFTNATLKTENLSQRSTASISKPQYDTVEWSGLPE